MVNDNQYGLFKLLTSSVCAQVDTAMAGNVCVWRLSYGVHGALYGNIVVFKWRKTWPPYLKRGRGVRRGIFVSSYITAIGIIFYRKRRINKPFVYHRSTCEVRDTRPLQKPLNHHVREYWKNGPKCSEKKMKNNPSGYRRRISEKVTREID